MDIEAAVEQLHDENARRAVHHKPKPLVISGGEVGEGGGEY